MSGRKFDVVQSELIGSGQYGTVFKASLKDRRELVAFKSIKSADSTDGQPENRKESFEREAQICCQLDHTNVVKVRYA